MKTSADTELLFCKSWYRQTLVNNYIWLGPMGEGNHHADHHDFPRDYRNGFGWLGWVLDPTRYAILALRGLGLVSGLNHANRRDEAALLKLHQNLQKIFK